MLRELLAQIVRSEIGAFSGSIGCGIFDRDDNGKPFKRDDSAKSIESNIKALGELKSQDRLKIFTILFPQFAPRVEATWQSFKYSTGSNKRRQRSTLKITNYSA
ncbi:hypothetical protein [Chamaesiphon sp.]|uniref:hypothetical protein n=1 Tax=Chamaesiphon sp. TaxID=2814140 RepID=UPI0035940767